MPAQLTQPGVYIQEIDAFPNSVVPVATAVPAFIGYTERADYKGKDYFGKPVRIESFDEFLTYFGVVEDISPSHPARPPCHSLYHIVESTSSGDLIIGGKSYDLLPDPGSIYYLEDNLRLFYQNGGGVCYIVSVGALGAPTGKPLVKGAPLVNPNMKLADLQKGLTTLAPEPEPTLIVVPDAVLLTQAEYATLMKDILSHCGSLGSRISILDVQDGGSPDPGTFMSGIDGFRAAVGDEFLSYGAAYYPFLQTTITQSADISFANLGNPQLLGIVLPGADSEPLKTLLAQVSNAGTSAHSDPQATENALRTASQEYTQLQNHLLAKINILPPSGAIAGIYMMIDNSVGVWKAPANVSLSAVIAPTLALSDADQAPLNNDPTGKSVNAIRLKPGLGSLV